MRENIFALSEEKGNIGGRKEFVCGICGVDCVESRYRCVVQPDLMLCGKCYDQKKYPLVFGAEDFQMELTRIQRNGDVRNHSEQKDSMLGTEEMANGMLDIHNDPSQTQNTLIAPWSDEERRKLAEALSKYHDNWPKVSEHVGRDS